jgi:hypothetical protein
MSSGRRSGSSSSSDAGNDATTSLEAEDKKIIPYSKQLPTLTLDNFVEFKSALENLAYFAEWHERTLDLKLNIDDPWDGTEEADKKRQKTRKLAYAILRLKMGTQLRHLLTGVTPGDARGLWKRIHNRFCTKTAGSFQALKTEAENLSMQSTHLNVEKYSYHLQQKFKFMLEIEGEEFTS